MTRMSLLKDPDAVLMTELLQDAEEKTCRLSKKQTKCHQCYTLLQLCNSDHSVRTDHLPLKNQMLITLKLCCFPAATPELIAAFLDNTC